MILLAEDDQGIAAVVATEDDGAPDRVFVRVVAVALRLRHRREHMYGNDIMIELIDRLAGRADALGHRRLEIWGHVHQLNAASQAMCRRAGADFFPTDDPAYLRFFLPIDISD